MVDSWDSGGAHAEDGAAQSDFDAALVVGTHAFRRGHIPPRLQPEKASRLLHVQEVVYAPSWTEAVTSWFR